MPEQAVGRRVAIGLLIFVISLPAGYVVLTAIEEALKWLWTVVPPMLPSPALWALVLGVPTLAGILVALIRKHGSDGHNPMFGIALESVSGRQYPSVIGAIAVGLIGGVVIGPEAAMVCTGSVIGTTIAKRAGTDVTKGTAIGAGGAILALFLGPVLNGSFTTSPHYQFDARDLIGAVAVGALTALAILLGRFLSVGMLRARGGDRPHVVVMAVAGLAVGAIALAYQLLTNNTVDLVLTSGEPNVKQMLALGTASAILITIACKWLAYSITMGGGFRGGPFFPAMFIGAGIGAIAEITFPDFAGGAVVAGFAAAVIFLAHPKWIIVLIVGVALGLIGGGPALIPLAVLASAVAKLIPEVKVATKPSGAVEVSEVR